MSQSGEIVLYTERHLEDAAKVLRAPKTMKRSQEPHTNERGGQCHEGFVDSCRTIGSQSQFAKTMQPRSGTFDYPAVPSQSAPMPGVPPGQMGNDAALAQFLPMRFRIIGPVTVQSPGPFPGATDFTRNSRYGIDYMQQFFDVVNVGAGDGHRQRNAMAIRDDVMFGPQLPPIRRVFPGFLTSAQGAGVGAIDRGPRPIDAVGPLEFGKQDHVEPLPDTGSLPFLQVVPAGHATTASHLLGKVLPRDAGFEYEHDACEDLAWVHRFTPWVAKASRFGGWQQRLEDFPQVIGEERFGHGDCSGGDGVYPR